MNPPTDREQVEFLTKVQRLLGEGGFVASTSMRSSSHSPTSPSSEVTIRWTAPCAVDGHRGAIHPPLLAAGRPPSKGWPHSPAEYRQPGGHRELRGGGSGGAWVAPALDAESGPAGIAVSPDGANLYAAARTSNGKQTVGSVVVFDRNAMTGALTYHEHQVDGVAGVDRLMTPLSAITVAVRRQCLCDESGAVTRSWRSPAIRERAHSRFSKPKRRTGLVGHQGGFRPRHELFRRLPLRHRTRRRRARGLKRDIATGRLDFLEFHQEVVPDVNVLGGAEAVAVAPDFSGGVYVVGSRPDTVVTFNADRCGDGHPAPTSNAMTAARRASPACATGRRRRRLLVVVSARALRADRDGHVSRGHSGRWRVVADQERKRRSQGPSEVDRKGAMTPLAQYGDPVTTASYVLCIYDGSANPQPVSSRAAPVGASATGSRAGSRSRRASSTATSSSRPTA